MVRIISGSNYRDPSKQLFIKLKILKCNYLVNLSILKSMYKAHQNHPLYKHNKGFTKRMSNYNLKGQEIFSLPKFQTNVFPFKGFEYETIWENQ